MAFPGFDTGWKISTVSQSEYRFSTMTMRPRVLSVYGTRPDAIKMAPVALELAGRDTLEHISCVTAQHRQMLDQVLGLFEIKPEYDLDIMRDRQTLADIAGRVLSELPRVLEEVKPDIILVHGDTSTAFISALSGYYQGYRVGHVEAGLRTPNLYIPFPEEANRRLIDTLCSLLLAPTENARRALLREGINPDDIFVTGNTVVDAFLFAAGKSGKHVLPKPLTDLKPGRIVTITAHRRESWGEDLSKIAVALTTLADRFPDFTFVFPVHLNPIVRESMLPILGGKKNLVTIDPLGYLDFVTLMSRSYIILTDSGGIQEEAPSLGIPVLVMREVTEREEGIDAGCLRLVGTSTENIVREASQLLENADMHAKMSKARNPYGDGKAAWRIGNILERVLTGEDILPRERLDDRFHFIPA
jgi:UDP-N-acetylglucosamine 2-epimerase